MAEKKKAKIIRRVKNAALFDNGRIRVSNVRFSYPHLDKPFKKEGDSGVAKYGIVGLLPKDTHKEAKKLIDEQIAKIMEENKVRALASDKKFLRDGDESDKEEHNGHWTLSAREERRPVLKELIDGELQLVEPEEAKETFQGGYWGSILIDPWWQNNKHGKRVNASLRAVTKKAEDETFGEGRISEEEAEEAFEDDDDFEGPRQSGGSKKPASRYEDDEDDDDL
jgi:hypothetical protein